MSSEYQILSAVIVGFALIIAAVAFGSAIGDGIVASRAVEAIARQPEAEGNILKFMFVGIGVLEAFPVIGLGLACYLFFVVAQAQVVIPTVIAGAHH